MKRGFKFVSLALSAITLVGMLSGCLILGGGNRGGGGPDPVVVAAFIAAADVLNSKLVHFNASASSGDVAFYSWVFGDGKSLQSDTPNVSHEYADFSEYIVTLTVTDVNGKKATTEKKVLVSPFAPIAVIMLERLEVWGLQTDSTVRATFSAESSYADGELVYAEWWHGDGSGQEGDFWDETTEPREAKVTHVYSKPGKYIVTLTVRDEHGAKHTVKNTIDIQRIDAVYNEKPGED